jgi:hypothetical protein
VLLIDATAITLEFNRLKVALPVGLATFYSYPGTMFGTELDNVIFAAGHIIKPKLIEHRHSEGLLLLLLLLFIHDVIR